MLLANEFDSARIVLEESHSGAGLKIVAKARSRQEFDRRMKDDTPDVLLVESAGIPGLSLGEVVDSATAQDVPVIVLGREDDDGPEAIGPLPEGVADYVPAEHSERLPMVVRRVLRERQLAAKQERLELELNQAYDALLENQKLVSVGRLAASIAHEINNPLEAVTNLLYLLGMETNLSEAGKSYVAAAEHELERVAQISKQTLNFHRETRLPVRIQPAELLEEVLVLYARRLEERGMEVVRQYWSDASFVAFPGEMRQVLSNLIANAIEATPVGGRLTLRVRRSRKWSDRGISGVRILVADNGCGIAAGTRQNLGELFYTTKGQRGTGLGLWVTRAIVKRYGGDIHIYSSTHPQRHGTVFSIFIPTNMRSLALVRNGEPGGDDQSSKGKRGLTGPRSANHVNRDDGGDPGTKRYQMGSPRLVAS